MSPFDFANSEVERWGAASGSQKFQYSATSAFESDLPYRAVICFDAHRKNFEVC